MAGLEDDLMRLEKLEPGWDGGTGCAPKISAAALATARWFRATPIADGSLQVEFHAGDADIEIHIGTDGRVKSVITEIQR